MIEKSFSVIVVIYHFSLESEVSKQDPLKISAGDIKLCFLQIVTSIPTLSLPETMTIGAGEVSYNLVYSKWEIGFGLHKKNFDSET